MNLLRRPTEKKNRTYILKLRLSGLLQLAAAVPTAKLVEKQI